MSGKLRGDKSAAIWALERNLDWILDDVAYKQKRIAELKNDLAYAEKSVCEGQADAMQLEAALEQLRKAAE